jgi:tripartite-type tricarboxylate transporter receptor subunit TctC
MFPAGFSMRSLISAITLTALSWLAPTAHAQQGEAAFFKGKTVRMVVGYGAGGGFDLYARMIAPYLAKNLGAQVVVENQPGAGGITALNKIMNNTPPD